MTSATWERSTGRRSASRIFGRERVENAVLEVVAQIRSWGYAATAAKEAQWTLCTLLLANGSPNLGDLSVDLLNSEKSITTSRHRRPGILVVSKALAALGYIPADLSESWRDGNGWNAGSAKRRGWHPNGLPGWTAGRRRQPCRSTVGSATT